MKFVTFNVRCSWDKDGINSFPHRAGGIVQKINKETPDVICFQEGTDKIIHLLRTALPDYHIVFNQRNEEYKGEGLACALRKDTTELLGLEAFWLSPTPNVPGSRYEEQSSCPRICQCVTVRCEDTIFRVYNLHLDHKSDLARRLGMEAALNKVAADRKDSPFSTLICGDFNATPDSAPIALCNDFEPVRLTELTEPIDYTFHNYGRKPAPYKIDYIFADAATADRPHTVTPWTDEQDGIYLSDHYPLQLELRFSFPLRGDEGGFFMDRKTLDIPEIFWYNNLATQLNITHNWCAFL